MSLYKSNWVNATKDFKTAVKIFMLNVSTPLKIAAFGIFDLSLESFQRVMNATYSLFAVFNEVNN